MGGEAQCGPRVLSPWPWFLVKAAVGTVDAQAQLSPFSQSVPGRALEGVGLLAQGSKSEISPQPT